MDNAAPLKAGRVKAVDYRNDYRTLMYVVKIEAVVILALTLGVAFYIATWTTHDRYFAETSEGRIQQMASLSAPNLARDAISNWAAQAASQIMTFGFNDLDDRFALSRQNFTPKGWERFSKAVMESKFVDEMMVSQQILTSVPESVPILKKEGLENGVYSWTFELRLLVTFRAGSEKSIRTKTVQLVIERMPTTENPNGVGISEWIMY